MVGVERAKEKKKNRMRNRKRNLNEKEKKTKKINCGWRGLRWVQLFCVLFVSAVAGTGTRIWGGGEQNWSLANNDDDNKEE